MEVKLNIYDISGGLARELSGSLLGRQIDGVWHTGVVVFGHEYFFGGGIQKVLSYEMQNQIGTPTNIVSMGKTEIPLDVFESFLDSIRPQYTSETYNLFTHNCNNFSDEITEFLTGNHIPQYILDLPNVCAGTPFGNLIKSFSDNFEKSLKY